MIINFTSILLLFALLQVSAKGFSQINLNKKNASLETIFKSIETQTDYVFFSKDNDLKKSNINIHVNNVSIETALDACFKGLPIAYKIIDKTVVIRRVDENNSEKTIEKIVAVSVRGIVTDENGVALAGVSVKVKGTS